MALIEKVTKGSLAKSRKLNELINKLNAIENMTVRPGIGSEMPQFILSDNNSEMVVSGGGSFELDVVTDSNTAGRASFNGGGVI